MTDEELIARLRKADEYEPLGHDAREKAADRIEALTKERDQWVSHAKAAIWSDSEELKETERKLAKAVEALQWCSGSADFNEGGVARKGWLKVCAPLLKGESHE